MKKNYLKSSYLLLIALCTFLNIKAQNNALAFDGIDDFVVTPNTILLSGADITLEAWIYVNSFPAGAYDTSSIMGIETSSNGSALLRLGDTGVSLAKNKLQFVLSFDNAGTITQYRLNGTTGLSINTWYHVSATFNKSTQDAHIYINGVQDAVDTTFGLNSNFVAFGTFHVGAIAPGTRFLHGKIDEVRAWTITRSITDIRADMYREIAGNLTGLAIYYKLNETSGALAVDETIPGGTSGGGLMNMVSTDWIPSSAFSGPKNCVNFNVSNAYIGKAASASPLNDNFTIMAWFNPSSLTNSTFNAIVYNGDNSGGYGFGLSGNQLTALYGAVAWHTSLATIPATNRWYHVTMRRSSGTLQFFLDGKLLSYTSTVAPLTPYSGHFTIGNMFNADHTTLMGSSFDGKIDEVSVWDEARTDTQIYDAMSKSLDGNESSFLVAYYNFDNTAGTTLQSFDNFNGGGTTNDLTLTNMTNSNWVSSTAFNTWLNVTNSNWATASNWSSGSVPTSTDNVGIYNYTGGSNPSVSSAVSNNNIVIGTGATLTVSSNTLTTSGNITNNGTLSVSGTLTNNGTASTFSNNGTLTDNGTITFKDVTNNSGKTITVNGAGKDLTVSGNLTNNGTMTINSNSNASGSLIVSGTSSGNITYNRYLTSTSSSKWHLIAAPVGAQTINTFVTTGANNIATSGVNYSLTPYDNTAIKGSAAAWAHWTNNGTGAGNVSGAGNFTAGKGYEILTTADGTVAFTGTVPVANVSIAITKPASNNAWNLIGNPFPSSIFANSAANTTNNFITVNSSTMESSFVAIYLWNPASGSYNTINQASGATYIAPGQGFFVKSKAGGATVDFTTAMRTNQSSVAFQRPATTPMPSIVLSADNNTGTTSTTTIKYMAGMSLGLDPGYDAGRFDAGGNTFGIYSKLVNDNGVDFSLQVLPDNVYDTAVIPIGLDADAGTQITFKAQYTNLPLGKKVFLEDRLMGSFTEINNTNKTYTLTLSTQSQGTGRFYLHTQDNSSTLAVADINRLKFRLVVHPKLNTIRIFSSLNQPATLKLYDALGRFVFTAKLKATSENELRVPNLSKGIYFVKIESSKGNYDTKIAWY